MVGMLRRKKVSAKDRQMIKDLEKQKEQGLLSEAAIKCLEDTKRIMNLGRICYD